MFLDKDIDITHRTSPMTPPWKAVKSGADGVIKWLDENLPALESLSESRIETMVNNLLWYTGEYDKTLEYRVVVPGRGDASVSRKMLPRIFNHLHDITEQRVSKMSRYKPGFDVVPTNSEENDRVVTRLIKTAQEAVARRVKMEFIMQEAERWNAVFGEIYMGIEWNKDIGDRVSRGSIERVGDVDIYVKAPWTIFPEPKRKWEEVKWCVDIESIMQIEEARIRFNKPKLEPDGKKNIYSFNADIEEKREDEVVIRRLIIPPSLYLPKGYVGYTACGVMLQEEKEAYPYSHNEFPWERHTDIDVPGRLFPQSFYQHIKPIQHIYNKLTSIIVRNIMLTAHPHIVMPKGSAKREAFANGPTFIEYSGQTKPEVITWSSVPNEVFQFRQEVKAELGQVSGIQGVSRGAPPPGSRSNSMLRFYEEQEEQRASTQIIKHNEFIRRIHLKSASIIADYYPTSNKARMIRVVGKENQYLVEKFVGIKISSEYDVIIQNSTGFSDSMAARLEEVQLVKQIAPTLLSDEQVADVLETKNPQKMYDIATAALKKASMENELFIDGKDVPAPKPYEDLIVHWKQHSIFLNSPQLSNVPEESQEALTDHVQATEMLMERKAEINATFAQALAELRGYPAFWVPTPKPKKPEAPQPAMQPPGVNPMFPMGAPPAPPGPSMEAAPQGGVLPEDAPMSDVPPAISAEELMQQQ